MMANKIRQIAVSLADWEIWLVTAVVAASFISTQFLPWAVGIPVGFWFIRWIGKGRLSMRTPADLPIGVMVFMSFVTLWATALPDVTLPQVYRLLSGIMLYYAIVNWGVTFRRLRRVVIGVALMGAGLALFAPFSVEWYVNKLPAIPQWLYSQFLLVVKDTVHRNVMGGALVIILPVVIAIILFAWRNCFFTEKILFGFAALLMGCMLVLTQSRGALLGLGVALVVLVTLRWRWGWLVIPVIGVYVGVITLSLGPTHVVETIAAGVSLEGLPGRLEVWSRAIMMIQDFFFTGIGMGTFGPVADAMYPFFLAAPGSTPHAHNLFLQVAVDLGVPGMIAWVAVLITVLVSAWKIYRRGQLAGNPWMIGLGAGLLSSQAAMVMHGMFDAVTWGMVKPAPLVWALWGLAAASLTLCVHGHRA
jgi:putative inorganic carbon (hco3(-)) transporter